MLTASGLLADRPGTVPAQSCRNAPYVVFSPAPSSLRTDQSSTPSTSTISMPGSPSPDDDKNENPWEAEAAPEPCPTSSPALDDVALRDDELKEDVAGSPTAPHPAADLAEPVKSPPGFGSFDLDGAIIAVLLVNFHHLVRGQSSLGELVSTLSDFVST